MEAGATIWKNRQDLRVAAGIIERYRLIGRDAAASSGN